MKIGPSLRTPAIPARTARGLLTLAALTAAAAAAFAGGSGENVALIIDPTDRDSLYLGNYYKNARGIPDSNILYYDSGATNWDQFRTVHLPAFQAALEQRGIAGHVDFVVLAPLDTYRLSASGYVSDTCFPVTRFSISSAYTMAFISDVVAGGVQQSYRNNYYSNFDPGANAFSSTTAWLNGNASTSGSAQRYYIGCLLGYTGEFGNTVDELKTMIDRSVASDGTRPSGTFYFMNTTDGARNVRAASYPPIVSAINGRGGNAVIQNGTLPNGAQDALAIMTGIANFDLPGANITILPGAFCDHLTSFAGTFAGTGQTPLSRWIAGGASGSSGAVDEPCNYTGKFVSARFHSFYQQGLSLGECFLRTSEFVPFQGLLYGDPLTKPFAYLPTISVSNPPTGPVSGNLQLNFSASTSRPSTSIAAIDVYVDGVFLFSRPNGFPIFINTTTFSDGVHDVRLVARDNSIQKTPKSWQRFITFNNSGQSASITPSTTTGTEADIFTFTLGAVGGDVREVRLLQNGRVLAADEGAAGSVSLTGQALGAGPSIVQAEALFQDGSLVRSAPVSMTITRADTTATSLPVAFSYTKFVQDDAPFFVELPASFDGPLADATFQIVSAPAQSTVSSVITGPVRLITPMTNAQGFETMTFRVTTAAGTSAVGEVTLVYTTLPPAGCPADWDQSGGVDGDDITAFFNDWQIGNADIDGSGGTDGDDITFFFVRWQAGC